MEKLNSVMDFVDFPLSENYVVMTLPKKEGLIHAYKEVDEPLIHAFQSNPETMIHAYQNSPEAMINAFQSHPNGLIHTLQPESEGLVHAFQTSQGLQIEPTRWMNVVEWVKTIFENLPI